MEMESRRRALEEKRRNRKRQLRRRIFAGGLALGGVCLAVGVLGIRRAPESDSEAFADMAVTAAAGGETGAAKDVLAGAAAETGRTETAETDPGAGSAAVQESGTAEISGREMTVAYVPEEELPGRFDLREQGNAPTVPDQGTFGTCWAFASLGALESSMPGNLRSSLSADHMSLQNSFGLDQNAGGDYSISSAYLLAWQGPVAEQADPYGDGYSPDNLEPVCHVQEIRILKEKDYDAIKRAIYENGGVQSAFYMPQTSGEERDRYYNEETYAFYYDGSLEPNHDVVIVGWEDSYPKENFVKAPEADGAFLCMNTWGESFGDRGYFYISYEDSRIGTTNAIYTAVEETSNYDKILQTDLCGWTGQLGYGGPKAWFANVYEADTDGFLAAAGFYATVPETAYRVYVTPWRAGGTSADGPGEQVSGEGVSAVSEAFAERTLVAEGQFTDAGYYTVAWNEEVPVRVGERFAVLVEVDAPGTEEPVAVEYAAGERTSRVDISDGEGYVSPDGEHWQRAEEELQCNVCLKAYLRNEAALRE